jgi:hypothetical protein
VTRAGTTAASQRNAPEWPRSRPWVTDGPLRREAIGSAGSGACASDAGRRTEPRNASAGAVIRSRLETDRTRWSRTAPARLARAEAAGARAAEDTGVAPPPASGRPTEPEPPRGAATRPAEVGAAVWPGRACRAVLTFDSTGLAAFPPLERAAVPATLTTAVPTAGLEELGAGEVRGGSCVALGVAILILEASTVASAVGSGAAGPDAEPPATAG